jgi:cell wall-associated NlpC family hydrolase
MRWIVGFLPLLPLLLLIAPARERDVEDLRRRYGVALRAYAGTAYVWGGEGRLGIDCSGLVRRALIDACLESAWTRRDPGALRQAIGMWWHDQSAAAIGQGEAGTTVRLFRSGRVAGLSEVQALKPGDLAVLGGGSHVMAYLGRSSWIEADPGEGKVVVLVSGQPNSWLGMPAQLVRWRILSD